MRSASTCGTRKRSVPREDAQCQIGSESSRSTSRGSERVTMSASSAVSPTTSSGTFRGSSTSKARMRSMGDRERGVRTADRRLRLRRREQDEHTRSYQPVMCVSASANHPPAGTVPARHGEVERRTATVREMCARTSGRVGTDQECRSSAAEPAFPGLGTAPRFLPWLESKEASWTSPRGLRRRGRSRFPRRCVTHSNRGRRRRHLPRRGQPGGF